MAILCAVYSCWYIADSSIEDFPVCALHDAPQTRGLLEKLQRPGAFWMDDRPIVCPIGELQESDFEEKTATEGAIHCWDDPNLANVPDKPSWKISPAYDLTRTDYLGL
jgi:hypothetical protein